MAAPSNTLSLEVATPLGLALKTEVDHVEAPSVQGEFGIYPGHRPLLAALRSGLLRYTQKGKEHIAVIGPGFAEAEPDKMLILTDRLVLPADIDVAEVKTELREAEEKLKAFPEFYEGAEYDELQRNVDWAHARLEAAELARK